MSLNVLDLKNNDGKQTSIDIHEVKDPNFTDNKAREIIQQDIHNKVTQGFTRKEIEKNISNIIHFLAQHVPTEEDLNELKRRGKEVMNICSNETLEATVNKATAHFTDFINGAYKSVMDEDRNGYKINFSTAIYKSIINPRNKDLQNIMINIEKQNFKMKDSLNDVDDMLARLTLHSLGIPIDRNTFVEKHARITHKDVVSSNESATNIKMV